MLFLPGRSAMHNSALALFYNVTLSLLVTEHFPSAIPCLAMEPYLFTVCLPSSSFPTLSAFRTGQLICASLSGLELSRATASLGLHFMLTCGRCCRLLQELSSLLSPRKTYFPFDIYFSSKTSAPQSGRATI